MVAKLVDVNNRPIGTQKNDPPAPNSPDKEIIRVLRLAETAARTDLAETCSILQSIHETGGWNLTHDARLPDMTAEVVIIMKIRRNADGKLQQFPERWVALGKAFIPALELLRAEAQKAHELANQQDQKT